jgi:hypothetical protein
LLPLSLSESSSDEDRSGEGDDIFGTWQINEDTALHKSSFLMDVDPVAKLAYEVFSEFSKLVSDLVYCGAVSSLPVIFTLFS